MAKQILNQQNQLLETQWWSEDKLKNWQFDRLDALIKQAARNVKYYSELFKVSNIDLTKKIDPSTWNKIPILTRSKVRNLGEALFSKSYPASQGASYIVSSGGSTGSPIIVKKTDLDNFIWNSNNLREELWHRDFFLGTIANLKGSNTPEYQPENYPKDAVNFAGGIIIPNWGRPTSYVWETGKMGIIRSDKSLAEQANFLIELQPNYLIIRPSNLRLLISYFHENKIKLSSLRSVWTLSEIVDESLRIFCKETFGCRIIENYSSAEFGYIALQCPSTENFHVMSEAHYVEIINDNNETCLPGEIGRVVITSLHNFAMPLIRYEIGDQAEVGHPCKCGRGLPTIKRIIGRLQYYLTLKNGTKRHFDINHYAISSIRSIVEFQLVQISFEKLQLRLVIAKSLNHDQIDAVNKVMQKICAKDFLYEIIFCEKLERAASGKLLQFISELG
jgi:phenylacetate-CoA ligase